ncbi:MAG: zinc ribbon domain-containing protein [Chloroflexi bacterium]|jgi:putative FmdB family regulatory protein|nr:zinc ribbon domain-containing protein [Chloroflexota bacterium]
MPIYEFDCPGCGRTFDKRVKFSEVESVVCPLCGNRHVKKRLPTIAVKGSGGSSASSLPVSSGVSL